MFLCTNIFCTNMYFVLCVTKCAAYLGQDPLVNEILIRVFNSWLNKCLIILTSGRPRAGRSARPAAEGDGGSQQVSPCGKLN